MTTTDLAKKLKIYTASSWRNARYESVVSRIKEEGFEVYDFRNPPDNKAAFHWTIIDSNWMTWDSSKFRESINHPIAQRGFNSDKAGMDWADVCVLITPSGKSSHLEAGYMVGRGKPLFILLDGGEPELTYSLATKLCISVGELIAELEAESP